MTDGLFLVGAAVAAVWALAAAVLARRGHRLAPVAAVVAVAFGSAAVAEWFEVHRDGDSLAADLVLRAGVAVVPAAIFHLVLALPDGRLSRPSHRTLVVSAYIGAGVVTALLMTDRAHLGWWPLALAWLGAAAAFPVAHRRYRSATVMEQRFMQWVGWGGAVAVEIALVAASLTLLTGWPHHLGLVSLGATAAIPGALIAGTGRRAQGRIDRVLTHTVALTGATVLVMVAYLIAIAAFGRRPDGSERSLLLLSMAAAAAVALAYHPVRIRLSDRTNRLVYGELVSPDEALRTWGSRLTRAIPLDELFLQLAEALRKSMQLRSAQVWTGSDGVYELVACVPHVQRPHFEVGEKERAVVSRAGVSGGTWIDIWLSGLVPADATATTRVAPAAHAGELLGLLVCDRGPGGLPFTEAEDQVLTELARQVGLALHNVQLDTALQASLDELRATNDELRASRARIVAAGDGERRKLERNLHDGAQQHLVALAVKLRLARDAVTEDPADAEALIDEVRGDLQGAITELRALAHGIYPPLLASGGLGEALTAAAGRAALPTTVHAEVGRFPEEVEAAVYFCCLEALQNAGKHAGDGATAMIDVASSDGHLCWSVRDDGAGFDVGAGGAGHGFVNLRDRMGALGGTVDVRSTPGEGTVVSGSVPVA